MFPAMYTHYYWEEKREEIYGSAPTQTRVSRGGGRRGGAGLRAARARRREPQGSAECLGHGATWAGRLEQLAGALCGRVLPARPDFREQLVATVCSCDDRDREKCRRAAARLGFTAGSNLPPLELNNRMRFNELYFHNILNSPQFTSEFIQDDYHGGDHVMDIVRGLYAARDAIFVLLQRCILGNDLKAYRLLDIIRLYTQKQHIGQVHLPLSEEEVVAKATLCMLGKGDHLNEAAKLFGCQIVLGLSDRTNLPPLLELSISAANLNDIKGVEEYFQDPLGYKELKLETETQKDGSRSKPDVVAQVAPSGVEVEAEAETEASRDAQGLESEKEADSRLSEVIVEKSEEQQGKKGVAEPTLATDQGGDDSARAEAASPVLSAGLNFNEESKASSSLEGEGVLLAPEVVSGGSGNTFKRNALVSSEGKITGEDILTVSATQSTSSDNG